MIHWLTQEIRFWGMAFARSCSRHRTLLLIYSVVAVTMCTTMAWLGARVGWGPLYFYTDFRDNGERYNGLMTAISAFGLGGGGAFLLLVARSFARRARHDAARAWGLAAAGLMYLGLDDLVMIHEVISRKLLIHQIPRLLGDIDHDVYVIMVYGVLAVWILVRIRPSLREQPLATAPALFAIACFAMSQAFDFLPWEHLSQSQQEFVGPSEEILKTLGAWFLMLFAMLEAEYVLRAEGDAPPPSALRSA